MEIRFAHASNDLTVHLVACHRDAALRALCSAFAFPQARTARASAPQVADTRMEHAGDCRLAVAIARERPQPKRHPSPVRVLVAVLRDEGRDVENEAHSESQRALLERLSARLCETKVRTRLRNARDAEDVLRVLALSGAAPALALAS